MYFNAHDLNESIKDNDYRIKNYFDTFGFVVIRGFIDSKDRKSILENYNKEFERRLNEYTFTKILKNRLGFYGPKHTRFKDIYNKFFRAPGIFFLPNFFDENEYLTEFFFNDGKKNIYDYFAGKDWLYMGSDGQQYIRGGGFAWHRDWFLKTPQLKIFFLIDPPYINSGAEFKIIPGGSNPDDLYTKNLSKASNWPMPSDLQNGLSDRNYLPLINNPKNIFNFDKSYQIPHVSLKLKFGDALFFDQRNYHCLSPNFLRTDLKMMSFLISQNPYNYAKSHPLLKNNLKEELASRVIDLMVSERNHCKCDPYGRFLINSNFYKYNKNHFINVAPKNKLNKFYKGSINLPTNGLFSSEININTYKKVGISHKERFRLRPIKHKESNGLATSYFFDDTHLGLMSDQIDTN
jgi:hypothetical protein